MHFKAVIVNWLYWPIITYSKFWTIPLFLFLAHQNNVSFMMRSAVSCLELSIFWRAANSRAINLFIYYWVSMTESSCNIFVLNKRKRVYATVSLKSLPINLMSSSMLITSNLCKLLISSDMSKSASSFPVAFWRIKSYSSDINCVLRSRIILISWITSTDDLLSLGLISL